MKTLDLLDYLSTCVFAFNGTKTAIDYKNNIIMSIIFGFMTAVGGGTFRDLINQKQVFWLRDPLYIVIPIVFSILSIIYYKN